LTKTKFNIVIVKDGKSIKKEIKKKNIPEVVDLVIEELEEVVEPVTEVIKEEPVTEVIEEEPVTKVIEEEPVKEVIEEESVTEVIEKEIVTEVIEEEIEEVVVESVTEVIDEVIEEVVVESVIDDIQEEIEEVVAEPVMITLGKLKDLLKQQIPKKNTLDSYCRTIQQVYNRFKIEDMNELLNTKEQDIIDFIENQFTNDSTIKCKLCSIYKAYKILNIQGELLKSKIDFYAVKQNIQKDENKESNKKTIEEGVFIFEHFNDKLTELGKIVQDNTDSLNDWNQDVQLYCILKIYLMYGVLRPSEIIDCKITDYECEGNHINISTKQIVIHHHKNDRNGTKIIDVDDKKLLGILRKGLGKYLISNQHNELYQSSSAFTKAFKTKFGYNPYDLRKVISSKCISEGDVSSIKNLEHNQGHSLQVILDNYNVYTKSS
jgi:hypothetical protein